MNAITNTYHKISFVETGKNSFILLNFSLIPILLLFFALSRCFWILIIFKIQLIVCLFCDELSYLLLSDLIIEIFNLNDLIKFYYFNL